MPGKRYGGFQMGSKYVRVSRRHQAPERRYVDNHEDGWLEFIVGVLLFIGAIWYGLSTPK